MCKYSEKICVNIVKKHVWHNKIRKNRILSNINNWNVCVFSELNARTYAAHKIFHVLPYQNTAGQYIASAISRYIEQNAKA